jgi:hypothetical protein
MNWIILAQDKVKLMRKIRIRNLWNSDLERENNDIETGNFMLGETKIFII